MKDHPVTVSDKGIASPSIAVSKIVQIVSALLLGTVILYGTGFVNITAVHNATHDARHSQGFPCH